MHPAYPSTGFGSPVIRLSDLSDGTLKRSIESVEWLGAGPDLPVFAVAVEYPAPKWLVVYATSRVCGVDVVPVCFFSHTPLTQGFPVYCANRKIYFTALGS